MFTTFHYFQFLWAKNAIKRHLLTNGLSTKLDILQTMTMYVVQINTVRTTKNVRFGLSYNQFFEESIARDSFYLQMPERIYNSSHYGNGVPAMFTS